MRIHLAMPLFAATCFASSVALAEPFVVTSIKPIHSLVSGVMAGVATPEIIVDGSDSPHTFSLRPSKAQSLQRADVVFWVGPQLEAFLQKPISNLSEKARVVQLDSSAGLIKLEIRESATFEAHAHDAEHMHGSEHDEDKHDHDEHAGEHKEDKHDHDEHAGEHKEDKHDHDEHAGEHKEDKHDHDEHAGERKEDKHDHDEHAGEHKEDEHDEHGHENAGRENQHADHEESAHGGTDSHFWLDPENAIVFVRQIEDALVHSDPDNAAKYAENARQLTNDLEALNAELNSTLTPVKGKPFIVFHDAYHYFENRFGVPAAGSVTLSPEISPGAERISQIKDRVSDLDVHCVFSEPQFSPKLMAVITENTDANSAVLDPLGSGLENGPDLYFELMRQMASSMLDCLTTEG